MKQKLIIALIFTIFCGVAVFIFTSDPVSYYSHGWCLLWNWRLLWVEIISNSIIWLAYMGIPVILLLKHAKADIPSWVAVCFGIFIFSCGIGHLVDILTYFYPIYPTKALINTVTAIVSVGTLFGIIKYTDWLNRRTREEQDLIISTLIEHDERDTIWSDAKKRLNPEISSLTDFLNGILSRMAATDVKFRNELEKAIKEEREKRNV